MRSPAEETATRQSPAPRRGKGSEKHRRSACTERPAGSRDVSSGSPTGSATTRGTCRTGRLPRTGSPNGSADPSRKGSTAVNEKPIPLKELRKHLDERDAQGPPPDVALTNTMFVVGRKPTPEIRSVKRVNG